MTSTNTIQALQSYCTKSSGDKLGQIWNGKNATYFWNVGRTTPGGMINGVVRKLAGTDASGTKIWAVAGSFKIDADGTILRFTGIPKKDQVALTKASAPQVVAQVDTVTV